MKRSKIVAAYLPQYHETPDNNKFWGKGFTDWVAVKNAKPLYEGHVQPKIPLNNNYYDLSDYKVISWQAELAKKYGIDAFNIYHYWFKDGKQELYKPAEILLKHPEVDIEYFFTWDNTSWCRTWGNVKGNDWAPVFDQNVSSGEGKQNVLVPLEYGDETQWEKHFNYLLPFFRDPRYLRINDCPVLGITQTNDDIVLKKMSSYFIVLAKQNSLPGLYIITSKRVFFERNLFDNTYLYEPGYSVFGKRMAYDRKLKQYFNFELFNNGPGKYSIDYEKCWKKILRSANKNRNNDCFLGAIVAYDDTPRRGDKARIITNSSPAIFEKYFRLLYKISCETNKELLFVTAWNEWGEGAYLEPDEKDGYGYLEALKRAIDSFHW